MPEPAFHPFSGRKHGNSAILQLNQVQFGFGKPLQAPLDCELMPGQRIALCGPNGSGKSTLIQAITSAPHLRLAGEWYVLPASRISLIDQHGAMLQPQSDCIQHLQQCWRDWHMTQIREHLTQVLRAYPGAMLVISHDSDWLQQNACTDILSQQFML